MRYETQQVKRSLQKKDLRPNLFNGESSNFPAAARLSGLCRRIDRALNLYKLSQSPYF